MIPGAATPSHAHGVGPLAEGRVVTVLDQRFFQIETGTGRIRAERALSCLVMPRADDEVAVVETVRGKGYIVAVLRRPGGGPVEIAVDAETHISSGSHPLRLSAGDDLELDSRGGLRLRAREAVIQAPRLQVLTEELRAIASRAWASLTETRLMARLLSVVVDHARLAAETSERDIEHLERARCGNLDLKARQTLQVRGEHVLANGRKLVRIDGDQIHLG